MQWLNILYVNSVNYLRPLISSQVFSSYLTDNIPKQFLFLYKKKEMPVSGIISCQTALHLSAYVTTTTIRNKSNIRTKI